jgi:hypothetical protein
MTALRRRHRNRSCFHGRCELRIVINVGPAVEALNVFARHVRVCAEKIVRPARALQRFADTMAGNGHLWANR